MTHGSHRKHVKNNCRKMSKTIFFRFVQFARFWSDLQMCTVPPQNSVCTAHCIAIYGTEKCTEIFRVILCYVNIYWDTTVCVMVSMGLVSGQTSM